MRDLRTCTLKEDVIQQLHEKIFILVCNLEKIFPPIFSKIIEHLAVHHPYEKPHLQEEHINEFGEPEQQIDYILLIDPHNHQYEDDFDESDDVCSDNSDVNDVAK